MIVSLVIRKMTRGRFNRWALALIGDILLTTVADICALLLDRMGSGYVVLKYVVNTIRFLGIAMVYVIFCGYLFAMIGIWHKLRRNRRANRAFYISAIVMMAMVSVVNLFTGIIFRIDADGMYRRGTLMPFILGLLGLYLVIGCAGVLKYRKLFSVRRIVTVFLIVAMMITGGMIQLIAPYHNVHMFFIAASFLLTIFGLQSPEERLHGMTGLYSMNAYVDDIHKYKALGTPIGITLSVMANFEALIEMFGFFEVQNIIVNLSRRLEKWAELSKFDVDLYYLGGGRFAAIADERYEDSMLKIAQDINSELTREVEIGGMLIKVMSNVCFIAFPKDIDNPVFLFSFDGRLEAEAYTGELRYAEKLFDRKRFELRRDISKVIERAFEQKLFYLMYQPIYSVRDKRFVRAEAFLRLSDPDFGDIRPDLLISEAEKINSIHAITTFVIEEVCSFVTMPDFLMLGLESIEINLSPVQCMWGDLLSVLLSLVKKYNVQPKNICFNINDVDNQEVFSRMHDNIDALSQVGFGVYMDDFGAGIFEVERIASMPLSGIKLDRSFVREGLKGENPAVFEGSIRMIEDLEIDAVAVGVEDDEMERRLSEMNCNYMQGYHFCRPLDKKELIRFILME